MFYIIITECAYLAMVDSFSHRLHVPYVIFLNVLRCKTNTSFMSLEQYMYSVSAGQSIVLPNSIPVRKLSYYAATKF